MRRDPGHQRRASRAFLTLAVAAGLLCATLLGTGGDGWGMSREELGRVLTTIPPNGPPAAYGNVTLRPPGGRGQMPAAVFPHWSHRARYSCSVCHLELGFSVFKGETPISRSKNLTGHYCGACHNGRQAFTVHRDGGHCARCHLRSQQALNKRFQEFSANLPAAEFGNRIDWSAALQAGLIAPQTTLGSGQGPAMQLPDKLATPLELGTAAPRSGVLFSHANHLGWVDCSTCHPEIFEIRQEGTRQFGMDKNVYGWFCGTCHMRVAFPMNDCRRCHPSMSNRQRF